MDDHTTPYNDPIVDLLDAGTPDAGRELRPGFEANLRRRLSKEWAKAPRQSDDDLARRRSTWLKVACAAVVVAVGAGIIIARSSRDDTVQSPSDTTTPVPESVETVPDSVTPTTGEPTTEPSTTATTGPTLPQQVTVTAADEPAPAVRTLRSLADPPFNTSPVDSVLVSPAGTIAVIAQDGTVFELTRSGTALGTALVLDNPTAVTFGADGLLYVLSQDQLTVAAYRTEPDYEWEQTAESRFETPQCDSLRVVGLAVLCGDDDVSVQSGTGVSFGIDEGAVTRTAADGEYTWQLVSDGLMATSAWPAPGNGAIVSLTDGAGVVRLAAIGDRDSAVAVPLLPGSLRPLGLSGTDLIALDESGANLVAIDMSELIAGRELSPSRFVPECTESASAGSIGTGQDVAAASPFGPFGITPNIVVTLPEVVTETYPVPQPAYGDAFPVAGGWLVLVRPSSSATEITASMLAFVGHDGSVRWTRCLDERVSVFPSATSAEALVVGTPLDESASTYTVISTTDGSVVRDFAGDFGDAGVSAQAVEHLTVRATSDSFVLLAPSVLQEQFDPSVDALVLIDLDDLSVTTVPWPLSSTENWSAGFGFSPDGQVLMLERTLAYVDGDWTSDSSALPPNIGFFNPSGFGLQRLAADGSVMWGRDDLQDSSTEGFQLAVDGDVVLVRACRNLDAEPGCQHYDSATDESTDDFVLAALDIATGRSLWELAGGYGVSIVADGYALVSNTADGWHLIDLTTGATVDGQQWPAGTWLGTGCCGADETEHTKAVGGAVVAVEGTTMSIYYPLAAAANTVRVTIP